jgi:glycosyltransferase involved in cell wall biosynthesis
MQTRSVLFYTYALAGGGAERVWALLSSGFAARGWDVTLAVDFEAGENKSFLDPRVKIVTLGHNHFVSVLRLAKILSASAPDISISAMSGSNLKHTAAATLAHRLPHAVLSFHGYPATETKALSRLGFSLASQTVAATAATVCVSDGLLRRLLQDQRIPRNKVVRIYNPVMVDPCDPPRSQADLSARGPVALASGRLIFYKNFSLLLRAFSQVEPQNARLHLLGEGPEQAKLEAEIVRLGLEGRVDMHGYVPRPWQWYKQAACFVSSSDHEPFGLVVAEALAHGLPVVATACDGPLEILHGDERLGALVPIGDEAALAKAISAALEAPGDPAPRLARACDFSLDRALDAYEALFEATLAKAAKPARAVPKGVSAKTIAPAAATSGMSIDGRAPRKLIFYTHALAGGGAERVWALLASGFARSGCEVILAVDSEAEANRPFVDPRVRLIVLEGGHLRNIRRLSRLISEEKPDAVLSALCISNLKAAVAAGLVGALDRTALSYHGFSSSESKTLSLFSYWITALLTRATGATVAVSDVLRQYLIKVWRGDPRRIVRIYNPIVCGSQHGPSWEEIKGRPPSVLAVGRLERQKNFDAVVRAFASVRPSDATLTILGEGPERENLVTLIDSLGLADRVRLVGYQQEPWQFYAAAKCLVVASDSEAFSLVLAEAMAYGLAVVSTDCRGPRELLADGRLGALIPIGDPHALGEAVSAALADPGDPAPRLARAKEFGLERALREYGALIDRLPGAALMAAREAPHPRQERTARRS